MGSQPESKLSRDIMSALRARGVWCFKVHGGPFTMAGVPDIIACVPVGFSANHGSDEDIVGIFVGFETKTPVGKDPSPIQERVHLKIRQSWGRVFVPRSVNDAIAALHAVGWTRLPPGPDNTPPAI